MLIEKRLLLILACGFLFLPAAEGAKTEKQPRKTEKTAKKKKEKQEDRLLKYDPKLFDPNRPELTKEQVNGFIKQINDVILQFEWPRSVKRAQTMFANRKTEDGRTVLTLSRTRSVVFSCGHLVENPDLEEVTGTRKEYFSTAGRHLLKILAVMVRIENSCMGSNAPLYAGAVQQFDQAADELAGHLKNVKAYKIEASRLAQIKKINAERREKKIEILMKKLNLTPKDVRTIRQRGKRNGL